MTNARKWQIVDDTDGGDGGSLAPSSRSFSSGSSAGVLMETAPVAELEALPFCQEWQLACRVAASKDLCRSGRLPKFLLYVCEQSLLGKAKEITEQRIGIKIFDRSDDYNPGEDNIVRSYARLLRKRLDSYFECEGSVEPMRIVIPRGGYVPVFQSNPWIHAPVSAIGREVDPVEHGAPATGSIATDD